MRKNQDFLSKLYLSFLNHISTKGGINTSMSSNIWQQIKEKIPARDVLEFYLGNAQKNSSSNSMWTSPFREGDNDPSLSAKNEHIKDFGGDFSGDIFEFLMRLKKISKKEALEMLVKDFELDIDISKRSSNKRYNNKDNDEDNDNIKNIKNISSNKRYNNKDNDKENVDNIIKFKI